MKHLLSPAILIAISVMLYYVNATGFALPVFHGYKGAFYLLSAIGAMWCTYSLKGISPNDWLKIPTIIAAILGFLILAVMGLFFFKVLLGTKVPFIQDARGAYIALAALISVKTAFLFIRNTLAS